MSEAWTRTWRAAVWAPASSPTADLVAKALGDDAVASADTMADLSAADVAVVVGVDRLGRAVRRLPPNVPLAVLPRRADLRAPRLAASVVSLVRYGSRVSVILVEGDDACGRLAALRLRIPVAMHANDVTTLATWLRRAHAYGYLCGRREISR